MTLVRRNAGLVLAAALLCLLAASLVGRRGLVAEEVQPYLARHPLVLERADGRAVAMAPWEPDAPSRPRWVTTSQWPVVAYDGTSRMWPLFIRGHQTALAAYLGIALAPALGGGIAAVQRSTIFFGLLVVLATGLLARRLVDQRDDTTRAGTVAAILAAGSATAVFLASSGYAFEVASRAFMMATLLVAVAPTPWTHRRALAVGLLASLAVLSRATIAVALAPAIAALLLDRRRKLAVAQTVEVVIATVFVPLVLHAAIARWLPFQSGQGPMDTFSTAGWWSGLREQLAGQWALLGDPGAPGRAFVTGRPELAAPIWAMAIGGAPILVAAVRWLRGRAADAERMLVAAALASWIAGALFYRNEGEVQLNLALEPLWVVAVVTQARAIGRLRWEQAMLAALILLRVAGLVEIAAAGCANPMVSARTQRAAVDTLRKRGVSGSELVTTTYSHAGVLEAWTDGAIAPAHAWPLFLQPAEPAWRALFDWKTPEWILLTDGTSRKEGPHAAGADLSAALTRVAGERGLQVIERIELPTESGAPGWALVHLGRR
jgi:hypothetical protein